MCLTKISDDFEYRYLLSSNDHVTAGKLIDNYTHVVCVHTSRLLVKWQVLLHIANVSSIG